MNNCVDHEFEEENNGGKYLVIFCRLFVPIDFILSYFSCFHFYLSVFGALLLETKNKSISIMLFKYSYWSIVKKINFEKHLNPIFIYHS